MFAGRLWAGYQVLIRWDERVEMSAKWVLGNFKINGWLAVDDKPIKHRIGPTRQRVCDSHARFLFVLRVR